MSEELCPNQGPLRLEESADVWCLSQEQTQDFLSLSYLLMGKRVGQWPSAGRHNLTITKLKDGSLNERVGIKRGLLPIKLSFSYLKPGPWKLLRFSMFCVGSFI